MFDMSQQHIQNLKRQKKLAEEYEEKGDFESAKTSYIKCAELARSIAKSSATPRIRQSWNKDAKYYEKKAKLIGKDTRRSGGDDNISKMDEEFETYMEGLKAKSAITWNDIAGLEYIKRLLKRTFVFSVVEWEEGVSIPPLNRILLFAPPGTGKTLLAMALSNEINATFFNVEANKLGSRYVGDTPRLISAMFKVAKQNAPSVVFIDEIDSLLKSREMQSTDVGAVQAFNAQMDGFTSKSQKEFVLLIAATNTPWDLDTAILSKFIKRIFVPLPDINGREAIFHIEIEKRGLQSKLPFLAMAERTSNYSGRDIHNLCIDMIFSMLDRANPDIDQLASKDIDTIFHSKLKHLPIEKREFTNALKKVKPLWNSETERKFSNWRLKHGAD